MNVSGDRCDGAKGIRRFRRKPERHEAAARTACGTDTTSVGADLIDDFVGERRQERDIVDAGGVAHGSARVPVTAGRANAHSATMGTAANVNYVEIVAEADGEVEVTAVVTGGVESNATCSGDPAAWRETKAGVEQVPVAGTINTMLLIGVPLTASALRRGDILGTLSSATGASSSSRRG